MNPTFVEQLGRFAERLPELERGSCSRDEIYNIRQFLEKNSASYIEVISNDDVREKWEALKHAISKLDGDQGTHVTVTQAATATLGGAATPLAAATPQDAAFWDDLADEVVLEILSKLTPKELGRVRQVSRRMRALGTVALVKKINNEKLSLESLGILTYSQAFAFLQSLGEEKEKLQHLDFEGVNLKTDEIQLLLETLPKSTSLLLEKDHLTIENLPIILDLAIKKDSINLTELCLSYASTQGLNLDELILTMKNRHHNEQAASLLSCIKALKSNNAQFYPSNLWLVISLNSLLNDIYPSLQTLCKAVPVYLNLTKFSHLSDTELKIIMESVPSLKNIVITSDTITTVPNSERLVRLNCTGCTSITALNVPNVKILISNKCDLLSTINAQIATSLHCDNCNLLTTINAPLARLIWRHGTPNLTTINVPANCKIRG